MTFNKAKGRMFRSVGWTWNPVAGCTHACEYCWAASLSKRWGRPFEPHFREHFMKDKFPDDGTWIFVGSMGDTFCLGVNREWIRKILNKIEHEGNRNTFLLQTKDPGNLILWRPALERIKDRVILGTTLETNRETPWSKAPSPKLRYRNLLTAKELGFKTFLSLEPLADFDYVELSEWVINLEPEAVEIGLENYTHFLPPPHIDKIKALIDYIELNGIEYKLKGSLSSSPSATHAQLRENLGDSQSDSAPNSQEKRR